MKTTDKVLVGAAIVYGAIVLGTRTTTVASIGAHEAMHAYWDGGDKSVQFQGDPTRDFTLHGVADVGERPLPHIAAKTVGWLVAGALLLPWLWGAAKVAKS